jgi:hypothetical protein
MTREVVSKMTREVSRELTQVCCAVDRDHFVYAKIV